MDEKRFTKDADWDSDGWVMKRHVVKDEVDQAGRVVLVIERIGRDVERFCLTDNVQNSNAASTSRELITEELRSECSVDRYVRTKQTCNAHGARHTERGKEIYSSNGGVKESKRRN